MATFKDLHIKTAKITKGDIIQQHIDTQSMWCGQYCNFCCFRCASP